MKKSIILFFTLAMVVFCMSCKKETNESGSLGGDQSPMGNVGSVLSCSSGEIAGISKITSSVTGLENGVSICQGSATVKNTIIKNVLSNFPGLSINGDVVSWDNLRFKSTKEGMECVLGFQPGIMVKYSSEIGDTYPIGSTGNVRKVVGKSTSDDYPYGYQMIKVIKVEENLSYLKSVGISKVTYVANHKFGLVAVVVTFDDGTSTTFPIYHNVQN
jgi:hypothetical protein